MNQELHLQHPPNSWLGFNNYLFSIQPKENLEMMLQQNNLHNQNVTCTLKLRKWLLILGGYLTSQKGSLYL